MDVVLDFMPKPMTLTSVVGGGALFIKQNIGNNRVCAMSIVEDIKANAIGYERITRALGASQ